MIVPSVTELRTQLLDKLRRDLIGPHEENELLSDRPTVEYLTGILYPIDIVQSSEEDEKLEIDSSEDDEETDSDIVILSQTMNPASIGLSFAVDNKTDYLFVDVCYGLYTKFAGQGDNSKKIEGWQRRQINRQITVSLLENGGNEPLENNAHLEWVVRSHEKKRSVSLFLVNRNRLPEQKDSSDNLDIDNLCLFQPHLQVRGEQDTRPFIHRIPEGLLPIDPDIESHQLLYRDCYEFAIGHGCAVDWGDIQEGYAGVLWTSQIPSYDLPATVPNSMPGLDMMVLGKAANADEIYKLLLPVLHSYEQWIQQRHKEASTLESDQLRETASIHLARCTEALNRMKAGLSLLQKDSQVFEAFRFANQAMLLQRSYSLWAQEYHRTGKRSTATPSKWEGNWRPFQIAFILLNLPGIANPNSKEHNIVDLLWFPTGGGKTEAYLGLTAFTLALRRLRGKRNGLNADGGVTVIMRYTLRLLTTQQFQRAATLICACERLRRDRPQVWGKRPFQIGLWVGSDATPNNIENAEDALNKLRHGDEVKKGNPVQLLSCPWCGEKLTAWNYHIDKQRDRMVLVCPRKGCAFYGTAQNLDKGIPALLVDDDIYHECPSLLLATVDKFARLPWLPRMMALFGKVDCYCPKHGFFVHTDSHPRTHRAVGTTPATSLVPCEPFLPPELIIQDELHLISGPLGTLSGLYETAIDLLCTYTDDSGKEIRPKVVASTATIRRADDQVQGLFAREVRLFPPPGLQAGDSFFAQSQPLSVRPGRCYVGVYAPGRSVKTALVRVYAILLQVAGEQLLHYGSDAADAYTTLLGYFNSLRELGGALRLVEDDIVQRLEYLAKRRGEPAREIKNEDRELTSRIASYKIPEILKALEISGGSPGSIDVLLATNMISVGVDIDRLGLMVVNGQPKTNAEYIQATSRIGRQPKAPGLVIIVYNWSRPRDISHYEHFRPYHEAIYRYVEATSVTPFAPRARDRALHAILIALARMMHEQWTANDAASHFDRLHPVTHRIRDAIVRRVTQIDLAEKDSVEAQITELLDWWQGMIVKYKESLRYAQHPFRFDENIHELMHPAEERRSGGSRPTLNSLRDVEGEAQLFIDWSR